VARRTDASNTRRVTIRNRSGLRALGGSIPSDLLRHRALLEGQAETGTTPSTGTCRRSTVSDAGRPQHHEGGRLSAAPSRFIYESLLALAASRQAEHLLEVNRTALSLPPLRLTAAAGVELNLLIGKVNLDVDAVPTIAIWTIHL
jgi:hypothetical protein